MPLIVVCGIPASGKTKRSREIAEYLTVKYGRQTIIVNEEALAINKQQGYSSNSDLKLDAQ